MKSSSALRRGRSVRNRILLWFLIIALIPLTISFALGYWTIVTESESAAQREMRRVAVSASRALSEIMNARCSDILVWSGLPLIRRALEGTEVRESASETLREIVRLYGRYEAVSLLDRNGVSVASSWPDLVGMDFAHHQAFKDPKATGKLYVGDAQAEPTVLTIDPTSNGWTLTIAAPIQVAGNIMGVLLAWIKWKPIEELIEAIPMGESEYIYVSDKTNRIIVHPRKDLYGADVAWLPLDYTQLPKVIGSPQKDIISDFANKDIAEPDRNIESLAYPGAMGNFPSLHWTVAAGVDRDELLAFLFKIVRYGILSGVGIVAGVTVLAILIAGSISRPITQLATVISQVRDTLDLTVRAPVTIRDEIGETSETFNALLARLQETVSSVVGAVSKVRQSSEAVKDVTMDIVVNATAQAERVQSVLDRITAMGGDRSRGPGRRARDRACCYHDRRIAGAFDCRD